MLDKQTHTLIAQRLNQLKNSVNRFAQCRWIIPTSLLKMPMPYSVQYRTVGRVRRTRVATRRSSTE
ncbi:hypothetical protein A9Y87_00870 [Salmonella enterica subsp. enterica]|nr:hypothetical protein A9Y87_00870 [Salmonella enterica subsp. enterica]